MREKLNELETFSSILNEQISTVQRYFDACTINGGVQNLETEHGLNALDFKGEAITFRETSSGLMIALHHCLDVVAQKEDQQKKKLDKEFEKRKKVQEELK